MNIENMLARQSEVDAKIMEKCELTLNELSSNLTLALCVELAELANEFQSFKHWKHDKVIDEARVKEELADCIAFSLAIINLYDVEDLDKTLVININEEEAENKDSKITYALSTAIRISNDISRCGDVIDVLLILLNLAVNTLNMSETDVEQAYMNKAQINIERQENGY
ncbi:dUTP diphosphatase [Listeria booriae]|uniref:dUTP diphosphatase n=1 Tax=Listeria booriae TaxID=1552123 RepID=UPI001626D57A|nr:dUTP diphosphatase [Listeria booriae]MBC1290596.1 hypothetical protein [Listeria booriae]